MDHLPFPPNTRSRITIPLLQVDDYDDGDFLQYPDRQKWSARPPEQWRQVFQAHESDFVAPLDTWSLFGTMSCLFGRHISTDDFVHSVGKSAPRHLSTEQLLRLLREFQEMVREKTRTNRDEMKTFMSTLMSNLTKAHHLHLWLSAYDDPEPGSRAVTGKSCLRLSRLRKPPSRPAESRDCYRRGLPARIYICCRNY